MDNEYSKTNISLELKLSATEPPSQGDKFDKLNIRKGMWIFFIAGFALGIVIGYSLENKILFVLYRPFLKLAFFVCAAIIISFHTLFAFEAHEVIIKGGRRSGYYLFHQYLLNFAGSFIGWTFLYYIIFLRLPGVLDATHRIAWEDILTVLIAFVGITGYLPYVVLMGKLPGKP